MSHTKSAFQPTFDSTSVRCGTIGRWSALAIGLALTAGRAHAQGTPAVPPSTEPAPAAPAPSEPPPPAGTTPATPPPQAEVQSSPLAEQQLEQIRKMVSAMPKVFEYDGYFRSGTGINAKGGHQDAFGAPGAPAKYRLGNEAETYGEVGLTANWLNPEHNDTWFKSKVKLAFVAPRNQTFDVLSDVAYREAFVEAGHVIESHPEASFWAGQRFYRRRDVHINDFFFNDMSGYGAGFQDLKLTDTVKLNVAYLGGTNLRTPDPGFAALGRLYKSTLDIRVSDIPFAGGNLEVWLIPTLAAKGDSNQNNRSGMGGGVFWFVPMLGGFNELSASFGYGGAANLSTAVDTSIAKGGWLLRVVDRAAVQLSPRLSMMWGGVFQLDNRDGSAGGSGGNLWGSAGVRPVFMLGKYTGVAVEAGVDVVKPETAGLDTVALGKLTVAGVIRPGVDFFARPELRVFVTGAGWNNAAKAQQDPAKPIGGLGSAGDNAGLTAGVQAETWW